MGVDGHSAPEGGRDHVLDEITEHCAEALRIAKAAKLDTIESFLRCVLIEIARITIEDARTAGVDRDVSSAGSN